MFNFYENKYGDYFSNRKCNEDSTARRGILDGAAPLPLDSGGNHPDANRDFRGYFFMAS